jgi:hypothetical protein
MSLSQTGEKKKKGGNIHLLSNIISSNEFISDRKKEKRMDIAITSDELLHCSPILFTVHASVDGKVLVQGNHNIFSCLDRIVGRRDGVARVLFTQFLTFHSTVAGHVPRSMGKCMIKEYVKSKSLNPIQLSSAISQD